VIRVDADLPSGTRARCWVALDVIVVEHDGVFTVAQRRHMSREQLADIALVLTEASQE
jgi:hypothetical protein